MKLTPHFSLDEFAQPAGKGLSAMEYPKGWVLSRLTPLCQTLEVIREHAGGRVVDVISGYRSPEYNRAIGGAKASQHMQGRAADFVVQGLSAPLVHELVLQLYKVGKLPHVHGLGAYPGFTHVDVRPGTRLARWTGSRTK